MTTGWEDFKEIWCVDFEFTSPTGEIPTPICFVAKEVYSGRTIKRWVAEDEQLPEYLNDDALFVAYFASAEMGCHLSLQWSRPRHILDLYAEFRCTTNGKQLPAGRGLLGACTYYGINGGDAEYKEGMRERIIKGAPYTPEEQNQILDYCELDVILTTQLFRSMAKSIDLPRALLRGRYMWAVAVMEHNGVPLDMEAYQKLVANWESLKSKLIAKVDSNYHVYEEGVFKARNFLAYLVKHNIPWETTPSGLPRLDEDFFKDQAKTFPILKPLQELRYSLSQFKLHDLQIGHDGRNRAMLSPFGTVTGRNTPSSSKFIFGASVWIRNLIKPTPGMALAYIDYDQQELGIAASLSGDENLISAYHSGDPYISFAKQAGAVPPDATKTTHPNEREQFKTCMLGINYGMKEQGFIRRTNLQPPKAKEVFHMHRVVFRRYWEWVQGFMDNGQLLGQVSTRFGWKADTRGMKPGTLQNWAMQSHGADILRLAICLCVENGIKVIAPIHDAILIEAPAGEIDTEVEKAQWCMAEASRYVINFPLSTDAKIVRHPDHYTDPRGDVMWKAVWEAIHG